MKLILTNGNCSNCEIKHLCNYVTEADIRSLGSNQSLQEVRHLILDCKMTLTKHIEVKLEF